LRQEGRIEHGQEVMAARFTVVEMAQMPAETCPLVDFDQQLG
jgi:hypothetical protein